MNIAEVHKIIVEGALKIIATGEEHEPMAFFYNEKDGMRIILLSMVFNDKMKAEIAFKEMALKLKPEIVGFVVEAWTASGPNPKRDADGSLANQPGSVEILMITIETKARIEGWTYPIVTDDAGVRLLDMDAVQHLDEGKNKVASRFSVFGHNDRSEIDGTQEN